MAKRGDIPFLLSTASDDLVKATAHARFGEWGRSSTWITHAYVALREAAVALDFDLAQEARKLLAEEITNAV